MMLNFSMNFDPSFLVGLELGLHVATRCQCKRHLHVYLPLSSSPGMTISYTFAMTLREGGERVQDLTS